MLDTDSFSGGSKLYRMNVSGIKAGDTVYRAERNETTKIPRENSRIEILPEVINYSIQDPNVGYYLEGFDDEWTNTGMPDRMRYFCMGNALVVPMITRMGKVLDQIIKYE